MISKLFTAISLVTVLILIVYYLLGGLFGIGFNLCGLSGVMVPQIAVKAKSRLTGEVREFGTICSVPWGWRELSDEEERQFQ